MDSKSQLSECIEAERKRDLVTGDFERDSCDNDLVGLHDRNL